MIKKNIFIVIAASLLNITPVTADQSTPLVAAEPSEKKLMTQEEIDKGIGRMGDSIYQVPEGYEFSEAEIKLWFSDHLKNITYPVQLLYKFSKTGSYEEGFTDSVFLKIIEVNDDGTKNADMQFFTGERKQYVRPENITKISGNPVLGIYMQGDIYEMDRYTGGSWRYFLNSIKTSIHDDAIVEPTEFEFSGVTYRGEKISFSPYLKDPKRRRFEKFSEKSYELIFSEDIPGQLYQIRTVIPPEDTGSSKGPLVEEVLTLVEVKETAS